MIVVEWIARTKYIWIKFEITLYNNNVFFLLLLWSDLSICLTNSSSHLFNVLCIFYYFFIRGHFVCLPVYIVHIMCHFKLMFLFKRIRNRHQFGFWYKYKIRTQNISIQCTPFRHFIILCCTHFEFKSYNL